MEVSEDCLGPEVHAALTRKAMREFNHGDALWPEEQHERDDPQPDRYAAIGGDGRNDVEVEDGDNKKQNEVPSSQHPAQAGRFLRYSRCRRSGDLVRQWRSLLTDVLERTNVRLRPQMPGLALAVPS